MIWGSGEPLSGVDNAWRRMGDKTNLMEITGVLMFEEPVAYDDLVEHLEERLLPFDRFRQRIVGLDIGRRPRWVDDEAFDIHAHVHHVALPEPRDTETFQAFVGDLMSRPIDRTKPLWQAYLVEGAGDANAVVFRIHHSIADGFALLYVLMGLADDPSEIEYPIDSMPDPPQHTEEGVVSPSPDPADQAPASESPADRPGLRERVGRAANMVTTAYESMTLDPEPATPLTGDLGVQKRVAWTEAVSLEGIRAAGEPYDATINDVLLAVIAGGLRRHLADRGTAVDDLTLRVTVPVNLKPLEERSEELGNYFGLGFVELPVSEPDFERRLAHIKATTGVLKQGTQAYLMFLLLRVFGRGPPTLQNLVLKLFEDTATGVITNVPGPTERFSLCGQTVEDVFFWVPQSAGVGLGLSIYSYAGTLRVGVAGDANRLPDPLDLAEAFEAEMAAITPDAETTTTD